jgi:hypothetical protein
VISIDINTSGAGNETPPAVGMCSADQVVLMAPYAAPWQGTGLPFGGVAAPVRLRRPGAVIGATVQTTAQREFAVVGVPTAHVSSTPGDLPPRDPLS